MRSTLFFLCVVRKQINHKETKEEERNRRNKYDFDHSMVSTKESL